MNKFVCIALLVLLGLNSKVFGQTYSPNTNQTYTTCSGTFYDSGGAGGNYGNNQNYSVTFCSGNGLPINLNFSAFALQSGSDILYVYAGINNLAPLIGSYSATSPGVVSSSSGCITIRFSSNNTIVSTGWSAVISCGVAPLPTYNITNGSITSCSGYFSDTGGSSSNYTNNQNYTFTICPSVANNLVQMNFSSFNLENNYDFLTIYNGPNAASPILGNYTGTNSPGIVQASVSNVSGCLTFVFTSDVSFVSSGWLASFNCLAPCQTITSNLVSTNPAPNINGVIQICPGTPVSFQGSGTFSQTGSGANYLWNYGNGVSSAGVSGSYTYNTPGTYFVNLGISLNGCSNANSINQMVQVSTQTVILTNAINQTICLGQSSNLSASAAPIPYVQNCSPPAAGNVFLPDGTGVSYTSPITVDCYSSGQLIQNASDIDDICLTIEHSYLGDLNISITCPNGQSAILKAYPGGLGAYLGCPLDDPAVGPGTSSVYCFNTSASTLLVNGAVAPCGVPSGNSIVAGDYLPVQPFTNLIGCPLNGQWVITITDNLALDNGYIFSWDINFNASLPGVQASFTPTVVSQGWITTTGLTPTGATAATVTPSSVGQNCYTYSATNNFGCTTTQVQCITVNAGVLPTFTQLGPYCQGSIPGVLPTTSTNGITGTWSAAISTAAAGSVVYTFTPTAGLCASPTTMNIVVSPQLIATISAPPILCPGATTTITVGASGGTGPYTGTGTYAVTAGTYTYTVTDINGCTSTVTITIAEPTPIVLPAITHN